MKLIHGASIEKLAALAIFGFMVASAPAQAQSWPLPAGPMYGDGGMSWPQVTDNVLTSCLSTQLPSASGLLGKIAYVVNTGATAAVKCRSNGLAWIAVAGTSMGVHTQYFTFAGSTAVGGTYQIVDVPNGDSGSVTCCTFVDNADVGYGISFAHNSAGYAMLRIDLGSWDGASPFRLDLYGGSHNVAGGDVVGYAIQTACLTYSAAGSNTAPSFGTAQNTNTYVAPMFTEKMYDLSISSLTMTGCGVGHGNVMFIKISRASGGDAGASQILSASATGVF